MTSLSDAAVRRSEMRRDFDQTFAAPALDAGQSATNLLAVRVGGDAYALRLADIAGLHVNLTVVPIPTPARHLLGIAAIRGLMAPIYELAGLLGYPPAPVRRWVVLIKAPQPIGLAFERFEGQLRIADSLLDRQDPTDTSRALARAQGAVQAAGAVRPILQVSTLVASIQETPHAG